MTRACIDLQSEIDALLADGYRLDMIMPADEPRVARLSRGDESVELCTSENPQSEIRAPQSKGRAGMEYRDLIPDRLGGRVIASHIRISHGGEDPDYVHYHKLQFQMIYCRAGRIRVVYEGQGQPFDLLPGDCVLQPPEIRHRVLEADAGSEVIEISCPAEHETWVEHEISLPTAASDPDRVFSGQRFVHHVRSEMPEGMTRDLGIGKGTAGIASATIIRVAADETIELPGAEFEGRSAFLFILEGAVTIDSRTLKENDSDVMTDAVKSNCRGLLKSEILVVGLPAV